MYIYICPVYIYNYICFLHNQMILSPKAAWSPPGCLAPKEAQDQVGPLGHHRQSLTTTVTMKPWLPCIYHGEGSWLLLELYNS